MLNIIKYINNRGRIPYWLLIPLSVLLVIIVVMWITILKIRSPAGEGFVNLSPPVDTIWTMYDTSLKGDIEGYINCFSEESQRAIKETLKSKGADAFRSHLLEMASNIMGLSIHTDKRGFDGPLNLPESSSKGASEFSNTNGQAIRIPVEFVYKGANKIQIFSLKRVGNEWRIFNISSPQLAPQPIPYGENVNK